MKNDDLKLKRIEEIKKLISFDLDIFLKNNLIKSLLSINGFKNKKAHEYQLGGYEWNPSVEEITGLYLEETRKRKIFLYNKIEDENLVNEKIKHLGIKKGDFIYYTQSVDCNYETFHFFEVSHLKIDTDGERVHLCLKGYDQYTASREKPYFIREFNLEKLRINNENKIDFSADFNDKKGKIITFIKANSTVETEYFGKSKDNYIIKDFKHNIGTIFINNVEVEKVGLYEDYLVHIGQNKYLNLYELKRSFCINKLGAFMEINQFDLHYDNNGILVKKLNDFLYYDNGDFKGIDYTETSTGLSSYGYDGYNGNLALVKKGKNTYVFMENKIVFHNSLENVEVIIINTNDKEDYICLKELKSNGKYSFEILKFNDFKEEFIKIPLPDDIKEESFQKIQIDSVNNLLLLTMEVHDFSCHFNRSCEKLFVFDFKKQRQLNIIGEKSGYSVTQIPNKFNLIEFKNMRDYSKRDFYPTYLMQYEVKGKDFILKSPKIKLSNEYLSFSVKDNGLVIGYKTRSQKEFLLNKMF